jgi:small subunit ribosomal protein S21
MFWGAGQRSSRPAVFNREERTNLTIIVHGNDIEKALRDLKRTLQRDGILKEIKNRRYYEKPSVKKKRKQVDAERRRRKALRNRRPERD